MKKKQLLVIVAIGILITSMIIYKVHNDKTKEDINDNVVDYIVNESASVVEESTEAYSTQVFEEPETQTTVIFRIEEPSPAIIEPSPIAGGVTYDTYDEEELLIAEFFTEKGYSDFLIIKGTMATEDGTGLELPEWLYAYTDSVNSYYGLLFDDGSSAYAIYVNGEVIYKEE